MKVLGDKNSGALLYSKHKMNPNKSKYLAKKISAFYGSGLYFSGSLNALLYPPTFKLCPLLSLSVLKCFSFIDVMI